MNKQICSALLCSILFISCSKKDSDKKEDIIQLQKFENSQKVYTFQYNDQNLVTRMNIAYKNQNGTQDNYGYAEFTYENGLPSSANYYTVPEDGGSYYLRKKIKYVPDASERIAYTANINYGESGNERSKDSLDLFFNNKNQITGMNIRDDGGKSEFSWQMNEQGNLTRSDKKEEHETINNLSSFEYRYDNSSNPFRYNGLGILVYTVIDDDMDNIEALFSMNNPVYAKDNQTTENKNENGQVVNAAGTNNILERTITYDESGLIKSSSIQYIWQLIRNGAIERTEREPYDSISYTCIKKQQ